MVSNRFRKAVFFPRHTPRLAIVALACVLSGCASLRHTLNFARPAQKQSDDPFEAGANRAPTASTLYAMARLFGNRGRDADCERALRRVIRQHPGFMPAYCSLAELYMRQQKVDGAIQVLAAGLDFSPEDPVLLNNLGVCRIIRGDYERALAMFTRAAAAMPRNARYRSNMAVALGMMGRDEPSLALFEQVVPPADAHANVAVLRGARNNTTRAAETSTTR